MRRKRCFLLPFKNYKPGHENVVMLQGIGLLKLPTVNALLGSTSLSLVPKIRNSPIANDSFLDA